MLMVEDMMEVTCLFKRTRMLCTVVRGVTSIVQIPFAECGH